MLITNTFFQNRFQTIIWALTINIVFWELVLRLFISSPCTQVADPEFGYMNIPEAAFLYTSEGFSRGRFNSLGFNDLEPITGSAIKRVVVLGDSYSESFQVPVHKSYIQQLETLLNKESTSLAVDMVKLARDGFTPAHYPALMKRMVALSPDLIILQFWAHSGGDLYEDAIVCEYNAFGKIESITVKPKVEDKGKEKVRFIINHSSLAYYALRRFKPWIMRLMNSLSEWRAVDQQQRRAVKGVRSLEDMSERLAFILKDLKRYSGKIIAFYIPEPGVFFRKGISSESETLKALRRATREADVQFVDLTSNFKDYYTHEYQPLNGFINTRPGRGHLNFLGHKVVAQGLYRTVHDNLSK